MIFLRGDILKDTFNLSVERYYLVVGRAIGLDEGTSYTRIMHIGHGLVTVVSDAFLEKYTERAA